MSEIDSATTSESPPASQAVGAKGNFIVGGRGVAAGQGWEWIASAFSLFKRQPGIWILLLVIYVVCNVLIALVPLIGSIANVLLYPVFAAGMMLGCQAIENGHPLEISHLFAGFKRNTSNLVVLGLFALIAWAAVLIPMALIVGTGSFLSMMHGDVTAIVGLGFTMALALLVGLGLSIPAYMALWFAPPLIVFHELTPVDAIKASLSACFKNIMPFLVYGVIALALAVIAAIPLGLGMLVLVPVIVVSIYTAYRDIFFGP